MSRITEKRFVEIFGKKPKPQEVWQQQFDGDQEDLKQLATSDWNAVPDNLFWAYFQDMTYMALQPDLFRHAFPACLKFWYDTLMRNEDTTVGDAEFHRALLRGDILEKHLTQTQSQKVRQIFIDGILDRIDAQNSLLDKNRLSVHSLIRRFNSIGLIEPLIPEIWDAWWKIETAGQSICVLQYASSLIYPRDENPIFEPWTKEKGGGPPYLYEWDAEIYEHCWLQPNLEHLDKTLSVDYIIEKVGVAALKISNDMDKKLAMRVAQDAHEARDTIWLNIEILKEQLSKEALEQSY